jgi:tol-pal system protein YbgF
MTMNTKTLRFAAVALALCAGAVPGAGHAADATSTAAAERAHMDALAQQLRDNDAQPVQTADLFGPSDADKAAAAAAAQHEQNQDANIATLNQRSGDIEDQLRKLTGQIEVLNHRIDELDQRIDRMKKDFDYKLCQATAQQLGAQAGAGQPNAIPCSSDGQGGPPPAAYASPPGVQNIAPQPTGVTHLAPPPGVLGTLTPQDAANASAPPPPSDATPPSAQMASNDTRNDTHGQFEVAMNLLAKSQYDAASGAFRTFADANPKDPLAPQALYWIGDIAYVQKDFASAARAFAETLKKYPTSTRAPESMLKLGQSLIAMNQKDEGCTALRALAVKYPGASKTVLAQAEGVRKSGGCKR